MKITVEMNEEEYVKFVNHKERLLDLKNIVDKHIAKYKRDHSQYDTGRIAQEINKIMEYIQKEI